MKKDSNLEAFTVIVSALKELDSEAQKRTLQAVVTFLDISLSNGSKDIINTTEAKTTDSPTYAERNDSFFSENRSISAKEFLREKSPRTDIERITCLAYYLTHYRETRHFKTIDLSTLNTEAAQPKFSNAAVAVDNSTKAGLLVQAIQGKKQISAAGELFVQALPDRDAAREVLKGIKNRRRNKRPSTKKKA